MPNFWKSRYHITEKSVGTIAGIKKKKGDIIRSTSFVQFQSETVTFTTVMAKNIKAENYLNDKVEKNI